MNGKRNRLNGETTQGEHSGPLRVIVADDDALARRMIKDSLQAAGIVVVAEARTGRQAVELTLYYHPDVVLMDVVMPELDGIAATTIIVREQPDQLVVILTSSEEDEMGLVGLRAGAVGYLTKGELDVQGLPQALEGARSGDALVSPRLTMALVKQLRALPKGATGMRPVKSPLTAREWEVIDLLSEGLTTDEIAESLVLSAETIRSHIKNLMRKLGAHSREAAIDAARRMRGA
jgi:NarL family two-component system response regulator LiaR